MPRSAVSGRVAATGRVAASNRLDRLGNPSNFSNLTLWLRDNAGITLNGSTVSQWSDQSGCGNHWTQGSVTRQPTYGGAGNGVDFDGSDNAMSGPILSNLITASACTIFIVFSADAAGTNSGSSWLNTALIGQGSAFFGIHLKSAPSVHIFNWDGSDDSASTGISLTTRTIVTARHGGGTIGIRVNDGSETTAASGNTTTISGATELGRGNGSDTYCFNGKIYEVVIYNTLLSDANQALIRGYLARRNGVST